MSDTPDDPREGGAKGRLKPGDGIPLYLKLASLFRDQIAIGAWPVGTQIGTLPELQAQYGVARATVQQAVRLLSDEGLLSSARGRGTFVTAARPARPQEEKPAYDLLDLDPRFSIDILSRGPADSCQDLAKPLPDSERPFVHIRKRHLMQGQPYSLVDLYIPAAIYDQLPAEDQDTRRLYAQLIRDHTGVTRLEGHQTVTIALATHEHSGLLDVSFAAPLARIDSMLVTGEGRQVLAHRAFIRADLFVAHRRTGDILSADPLEWRPTAPQRPDGPEDS
ncbi:GntR family transcriptional regulator [Pseudooceanicola aestuarii]|uniref:GntR family transcriptional regulator n=1 Tax=Pseudooceanicola aestuarii TaxID=2697319 RepID=UPI0013D2A238|nr:GntR family transcriptional regulator [Pseudooceanicola aestuarii]